MNDDFYSNVEVITPEIAREYLRFNKVNRPLNKETVEVYASDMRKGNWRLNGESICFLKSGDLSNGQHRLHAVIRSGCCIKFSVARNCDEDSMPTYDSGRNRKPSDVFAMENIPNYTCVSSIVTRYFALLHNLNAFSSKEGRNTNVLQKKKISRREMLDEYKSSAELYQDAYSFASTCYRKMRIMTQVEIGGMYVFLAKQKNYSRDFIEGFFRALFFSEGVSMKIIELLRDKLINSKMSNIRMTSTYKGAIIAKTWNAYVLNKDSKVLRWNEEVEGKIFMI